MALHACQNLGDGLWQAFAVQEYLVHLSVADFASGLNDRFCSDKLNYMYWCIPLSYINLSIFVFPYFLPSHSGGKWEDLSQVLILGFAM